MHLTTEAWTIEFYSGIPVYKQIVHHVEAAISQGRLREGDQLPTIRALHRQLKVNPNTVAKAYRELELVGLIAANRGSGCFVAPATEAPRLSARDRKAKLGELTSRFAAEAKGHGILFDELLQYLRTTKSHD